MLKVGITGGIGSGKTTICQFFELLGIPVFYADKVAKQAMQEDEILVEAIKLAFGHESYLSDNVLNRKYLASKVFSDEKELARLNSLVHPAVFRAFDKWVGQQTSPYVLKEAALLFESGSYKDCNYTVLLKSPLELRIERVMQRDNIEKEEVLRRIAKQWPEKEKEKLADFFIDNDENQFVIPQILQLHQRFLSERNL